MTDATKLSVPPGKCLFKATSREGRESTRISSRIYRYAVESLLTPGDYWVRTGQLESGWHIVSFHTTRNAAARAAGLNARNSSVVAAELVTDRRKAGRSKVVSR